MRQSRFILLVSALSIFTGVVLYSRTFHLPFAFDDVDYINLGARYLAGEMSLLRALFTPHSEHLVPGFRALYFPYLHFFGVNAFPWRVSVVIVHAASAVFLAILARRYTGAVRGGVATALVYMGMCGFTAMWIWLPTGATVPWMMMVLNGAAALLAWRDHLTARRIAATAMVVFALLIESAFAPMALFPALIDEFERRRASQRRIGLFSIVTLLCIAGTFVLAATIFRKAAGFVAINPFAGLPTSAFLIVSAPFRFFFPGVSVVSSSGVRAAILVSVLGATIAAAVLAMLVALWRRGVPQSTIVAILALPGAFGVLGLIGLSRWTMSWQTLYETDRYYFPMLAAAALLAGSIAASISLEGWPRLARTLLLAFLAIAIIGELALQRRAMLATIPTSIYTKHQARWASLQRLTQLLNDAGPIDVPRQTLWFSELHNGRLRTEILTEILCGNGRCPNVRLGAKTVDAATAARLNVVLDRWARELREPVPFVHVVDGRMINARVRWQVDSAKTPLTISARELQVVMTPIPGVQLPLTVRAKLVDLDSGLAFPIGTTTITQPGLQTHTLSTRGMYTIVGEGRLARLVLECDPRPHCVQLISAGSTGGQLQ